MIKRIKKRKEKIRIEDFPTSKDNDYYIAELARTLAKQINREVFIKKYAPAREVLKLVGAGVFLGASFVIPSLPLALKPLLVNEGEYETWKRFNIPYLRRTLKRLEKQKLVQVEEEGGQQIVKISEPGKRRILKYALEELEIKKPTIWDGKWRLVSYDIPLERKNLRDLFRHFLICWGFYPLHESVFLHAYSCEKEVEFLREYLGVGEYVRIFLVAKIENDKPFRKFFGM